MNIDFDTLSSQQIYGLLTQAVIPRPVAWVLSDSGGGRFNLAPFSYFIPVCSRPALVALSIGWKSDGVPKDTRRNIAERDRFVIHIAHTGQLDALNQSSATLDHSESEVDSLGLDTVPFDGSVLPRLADARVAMACTRHEIFELGPAGQALILGEVTHAFLADECAEERDGRIHIDARKLDPIARLGSRQYAELGRIIERARPT